MTSDESKPPSHRVPMRSLDAADGGEHLRTRLTVAVCLLSSARLHLAQAEHLSPEARERIVRHLDEAAEVLVDLPRERRSGNGHAAAPRGRS